MLFFWVSGILEDGFCGLFSYEFISFFETEWFFSMGMLVFLASSILENGSVVFFNVNLFFLKHLASGILVDFSVLFHMN